eukprot:m.373500 g.373500  ORF g.373500 m.373500 type:complete len:65 (+) comp68327_c0_seq1:966-1160(+)
MTCPSADVGDVNGVENSGTPRFERTEKSTEQEKACHSLIQHSLMHLHNPLSHELFHRPGSYASP